MTRTPPTPGGLPLIGHSLGYARRPFELVAELLADHGVDDAVGLDVLGMDQVYVLAHPEYFERVLVTERDGISKGSEFTDAVGQSVGAVEGDTWRTQRTALDPFFQWDRVAEYAPTMRAQVERRLATWDSGDTISLESEMKSLTLDIIFATILGRELELDGDARIRDAADGINGIFEPIAWVLPDWVPTPGRRRFDEADGHLREEVRTLIENADEASLAARLADSLGSEYPETTEEMEDQLVGMIFAGHETTALSLTYALYALATHPSICEAVVDEIDAVVGDGAVTTEVIDQLPLLERAIQETLRLYPPAHTLPRVTTEPLSTGERTIPEETHVHLSVIRVHRDERWYDDPLEFRPERWTKDNDRPPYAYVPFGAGPRSCLGRHFALTEAKIVLATLLRDFNIEWGRDEPLEITPEMTTQPKGPTPLLVRRR